MSLRRSFLVFAAVLAIIGTAVAIALIVLTTNVHRAAQEVGVEVESLRIGEELELGLISLREDSDPLVREATESMVRSQLAEAASYMGSTEEQAILADLVRQVDQYADALHSAVAGGGPPGQVRDDTRPAFESAFRLARQWMRLNVEQGRAAERTAARWSEIADLVGVAAILLLVVGLGGVTWWLQRRTFQPALQLAGAIARYTRGDRTARASEQDPEEFRTIARGFNDMAQTLERQRADQLAFLGGVAHDIRNPLNIISMAVHDAPNETRAEVATQVARIAHLASDLLDYAKPWKLAPARLDLAAHVRGAAARLPAVSFGAGLDAAPALEADPRRLEQALANLFENARAAAAHVHVDAEARPGAVLLHVCDDGPGVPAEIRARLFEPFASRSPGGTGLGLAIVARVMDAHGGSVALTERAPWNTCFTLTFPAP